MKPFPTLHLSLLSFLLSLLPRTPILQFSVMKLHQLVPSPAINCGLERRLLEIVVGQPQFRLASNPNLEEDHLNFHRPPLTLDQLLTLISNEDSLIPTDWPDHLISHNLNSELGSVQSLSSLLHPFLYCGELKIPVSSEHIILFSDLCPSIIVYHVFLI